MRGCRPLTDDEVQAVLRELGRGRAAKRNLALLQLGLRAGFRISELLSLTLRDVFVRGRVSDQITVHRKFMKGQKDARTVPLHPEAKAAIKEWIAELANAGHTDPSTYLFRSREGENRPLNRRSAWALLTKAYDRCGLVGKLGTHGMRKTFAKRVHEKLNRDLLKTQKALGHRRVTSTVSYLSFAEEEIDEAILKD